MQEGPLSAQLPHGLVLVACRQRLGRAQAHALHELELQRHVVLALVPCATLQTVLAQRLQHFGARLLHHQATFGGVHALVRIGGRVRVHPVTDERAHEVDGELGDAVVPCGFQIVVQQMVPFVHLRVARSGGEAHGLQLPQGVRVHFLAEQVCQQAVRSSAHVHERNQVDGFLRHGSPPSSQRRLLPPKAASHVPDRSDATRARSIPAHRCAPACR